jgi:putative SbcD/Mre11-related phosphoesterase
VTAPPDADLFERAVFLPSADTVVVADLHLGRARASDVEFPIDERGEVLDRLDALLAEADPDTVVVAGDLLHSFSSLPHGVREAVDDLRARVSDADAALVVTPGNHDTRLDDAFDGPTASAYELGNGTIVCHGHEAPETTAERYVIGHDHPAIEIEGRRYPCALYAPDAYRGGAVLALPAFTPLAPGVAVNGASGSDLASPLLADLDSFRPLVRDTDAGETLPFPPLSDLRDHL